MLHVHRAERTARLAEGLAGVLATPLADPFAAEVVAVPAKGVERWLAQRLSTALGATAAGDGICSGVVFPSAGRVVAEALSAARGTELRDDPWTEPVWPLLEVIDACAGEAWCGVLGRHLGAGADDHRRGRRWAAAARLAGLYRSYGAHRPQMLRDWAQGRDTDGSDPLPADLAWQAELWRRLRERLGPSPAERLEADCAALRADPALSALPERISVFGPTRLHADALAVLDALAAHRDVHLWLPHPSPALWGRLTERSAGRRRLDGTATLPRHPLLRSLARDVRELQLRLPAHTDEHLQDAARPATLLGRLQADLRDDVVPGPAALDDSVQVHACHGPARQVEVLRELLLRLFEDDPTLEPRDVLVMCPDVETFAPLISAAFGLGPGLPHPGGALRVRLADRSLRRTNPLLDTVAALLDLAQGRVTASQVLDLAATPGCAAGSGSPTRSWNGCGTGSPAPVSGGASTPAPGSPTGWRRSRRTPGGPGWTGCCSASPPPRTSRSGWTGRCPWTTSTAATSTSPAGSRSCSTGSRTCSRRSPASTPSGTGPARWPVRWTCSPSPSRPTPGSWPRRAASSPRRPRAASPRSASPTSARCSPTGCAAAPPAPTSAPAT